MSSDWAAVRFNDGEIMYCEYNGTSDVLLGPIYKDPNNKNLYKGSKTECECGNEEKVEIYSNYGSGSHFPGMACKKCKSARALYNVGYRDFEIKNETFGKPKWYKEIIKE